MQYDQLLQDDGKMNCDDTNDVIGKFVFSNGIHFHVSCSAYYKEMTKAIAVAGPSYVPQVNISIG
jgi:hypothetical protein